MIIKFKNGSTIETIPSGECIRSKRLTNKESEYMYYLECLACEIFVGEQLKTIDENLKPILKNMEFDNEKEKKLLGNKKIKVRFYYEKSKNYCCRR